MTDRPPSASVLSSKQVRLGGLVLVVLAVIGLIAFGITYQNAKARFDPQIPPAPAGQPKDVAEGQKADLEYLKNLTKLDRSFTPETAKDFQDRIDQAMKDIGQMSPLRFELEVAAAVARANNYETEVVPDGRRKRLQRLPIRMTAFAEGLYVVKATAAFGDLLGARVIAIGGVPVDDALSRFDAYHGGEDWARRVAGRDLLHSPEALQSVGLSARSDAVILSFILRSGKEEARVLNALPGTLEGLPAYLPWMDTAADVVPGREDENWMQLLANPDRVPDSEPLIGEAVAFSRLDKPNAILVTLTPQAISDKDLAARLDAVLVGLREMSPHHLILNLRRVGAGSADAYQGFLDALPQALPNGAVFAITGPATGGLGVELIARLQDKMPNRLLTLGLPPAQPRKFWAAAPQKMVLPHSGIAISFATRLVDFDKGCTDWQLCGWAASRQKLALGPFKQDVTFVQRFTDYAEGKDTAFEVIKALIGQPD